MKNWSPALQLAYAQPAATLAECVLIQPTQNPSLPPVAYTSHDRDLVVNGVTYRAVAFSPTDTTTAADLGVDSKNLLAYFRPDGIRQQDIEAGIYDGAAVEMFEVDFTAGEYLGTATGGSATTASNPTLNAAPYIGWEIAWLTGDNAGEVSIIQSVSGSTATLTAALADPVSSGDTYRIRKGRNILITGTLGKIGPAKDGSVTFELDSLKRQLNQQVSELVQPTCMNSFGDQWCTFDVSSVTETGSITGVTSRVAFADTERTEDNGYWRGGIVKFTNGENSGYRKEVRRFADGLVTLIDPLPFDLAVDDEYEIAPTCFKRIFEDCRDTWNNILNFRGFPNVQGDRKLGARPDL